MTQFDKLLKNIKPGTVALLGLPYDHGATFMRGSALAPARIREVLHNGSANLCVESGIDLETEQGWQDAGDLVFTPGDGALSRIEQAVNRLLGAGGRVLAIGGDHSVTYPILRAYARRDAELTILHLDAHPDLYDEYDGNRFANACPFARIMEEGLAGRLVQAGIRTMNPHQRSQADRFGVTVIEMREWSLEKVIDLPGPVYLSLDMDVLDPAFAPGVSHHEPGGMTTREVLGVIQHLKTRIAGADIVEFNPTRDPTGITAMAAAKFLKEIVARMLVE
jgi:agmatinase